MSKRNLILALILYVLSATISFTYLYAQSSSEKNTATISTGTDENGQNSGEQTALSALLQIKPEEPRDQECPLNGKLFTQTERTSWEKRRPSAVMIENSPDARPQSGLSNADIVFEIVAEGGVTRFMGIFYCGAQAYDTLLAPIRSARTYFIDYASGFNRPLYTHIGGANLAGPADALGQLGQYGWQLENDINGLFTVAYPYFVRNENRLDKPVDTEHTVETTTEYLWQIGVKREWTNLSPEIKRGKTVIPAKEWKDGYTPWTFEAEKGKTGTTTKISYDFWSGYSDYAVEWNYDVASDQYKRNMAGAPHIDHNNQKQLQASNVIVVLAAEKGPIDEKKHMLYTTTGTGDALLFMHGDVVKARWIKKERESELRFVDAKGKDIPLVRGLTWISVLDKNDEVQY
ncbi:DUF3048 domain-containing protein [Candidatus Woesebacteria bacterium]|nr:DUF3048 domain-containing protein [Candidatus Woesebacteria bacterium]